jgi:hypothetical protein
MRLPSLCGHIIPLKEEVEGRDTQEVRSGLKEVHPAGMGDLPTDRVGDPGSGINEASTLKK